MEIAFSTMVQNSFAFLISDYGYEYVKDDEYCHKYISPHLSVEIYYAKMELEVLLCRGIYTSILRPYKKGCFSIHTLLKTHKPGLFDEFYEVKLKNTSPFKADQLNKVVTFYGKALKEHFSALLKDDLKLLEEVAIKSPQS